jgi:SAM-dependent methyltransferase
MEWVHEQLLRPIYSRAAAVFPKQMVMRYSHLYAKRRYLDYVRDRVSDAWFVSEVDDGPAMSARLRLLTRALDEKSYEAEYPDDQFFYESYRQAFHFFEILESLGFNLRNCGSILDFGCGSARLLRLYRYIEGVRLVGSDANPECIDWCKGNVPGCEFYVNQLAPPLPFATGKDFDLIVSLSVFTHIPLDQQVVWLEEMKRVLRPGGLLLCTVVGTYHVDAQLGPEGRRLLREKKEISLGQEDANASLSTRAGGSHYDVFQRRDRVIEVFGSVLKLREYLPYTRSPIGQDLLILQKA